MEDQEIEQASKNIENSLNIFYLRAGLEKATFEETRIAFSNLINALLLERQSLKALMGALKEENAQLKHNDNVNIGINNSTQ